MNRVGRAKRAHALAMAVVPLLATLVALRRAWVHGGVAPHEVALFVVFYGIAMAGITVGYHRYFAHHAFDTSPLFETVLAICGAMAGQGPVIYWVSNHRTHHQFVDEPGDPHSPHANGQTRLGGWRGFFHAHLGWTWRHPVPNTVKYAREWLARDHVRRASDRYLLWLGAGLVLPALLGGVAAGAEGAVGGLLWGGFVRLFVGYHAALAIGSFAHLFGDRPHSIRGHSANAPWLALPTFGEGWHQNHHAFPSAASFGERHQLDLGFVVIRVLEGLGVVWAVRRTTPTGCTSKAGTP